MNPDLDDLYESIETYRYPGSTSRERRDIREWWSEYNISNQREAALRASEIEKETTA